MSKISKCKYLDGTYVIELLSFSHPTRVLQPHSFILQDDGLYFNKNMTERRLLGKIKRGNSEGETNSRERRKDSKSKKPMNKLFEKQSMVNRRVKVLGV